MPWCETCDKYWTPAAMNADGSCPTCGASLASPPVSGPDPGEPTTPVDEEIHTADDVDEDDDSGVPWHFKLLVVLLVIYLVYRFVEIGIKIFT